MSRARTAYDDALRLLCTSASLENFWFAYKVVKNASQTYKQYDADVRAELFAMKDLVLQNNDVTTATYRLAKLADKLSKARGRDKQNETGT